MGHPKISVISSVRNCSEFIKESIESILSQTYRDFEFVIYDDGSEDKTLDIINRSFVGSNVDYTIISGEKKVGCGEGRNKAIKQSRGEYIAIQDGDDISFPFRLEKEIEHLENHNDLFCVGSWATKINSKKEILGTMEYPALTHVAVFDEVLRYRNPIIDPSCMFRKDIFEKLGGYDKKWGLIPDFYLWAKALFSMYRIENLPLHLVYYRKHENSVTAKFQSEVVREHIEMCRDFIKNKGFLNTNLNIKR